MDRDNAKAFTAMASFGGTTRCMALVYYDVFDHPHNFIDAH
jgi:hypothetical protein